jgi:hypothetical protein
MRKASARKTGSGWVQRAGAAKAKAANGTPTTHGQRPRRMARIVQSPVTIMRKSGS